MDYDNYNSYERNFASNAREEAEFARERSRRFDRSIQEREAEIQWDRDRSLERQFGLANSRHFDESHGFGEGGRRRDESDFIEKDDYWDHDNPVPSYDYNHGMGATLKSASKDRDDLPRPGDSQHNSDVSNFGGNHSSRQTIPCDIKEECTSTIFLGGISRTLDERDIEREVVRCGLDARDVRIIRQKETGANRGFAFVDFHSVADAQRWMELNQGRLFLRNRFTISMDYSRSGCTDSSGGVSGGSASSDLRYDAISKNDWKCHKCGCDNFRRRIRCFRCGLSKEESEKIKPKAAEESRSRHEINTPTSTVMVRGLDGFTSESVLKRTLESVAHCRIRNIFIVRNETTGIGRGYGYMEFYSRQDAEDVVEAIQSMNSPLEIDGKGITVDYSRESYASVFASLGHLKTSSNPKYGSNYVDDECSKRTELYGYEEQGDDWDDGVSVSSSECSSSRRDQLAMQNQATDVSKPSSASAKSNTNPSATSNSSSSSIDNEFSNYAAPDLNRYVFDDLTGYYIDPMTGLYYDAGTQYFYHMETGSFLYWDPDRHGYVVVPAKDDDDSDDVKDAEPQASTPSNSDALSKQEEEKQKRAKEAQRIAKDMERWAKEQNSNKDAGFKKPLAPIGLPPKPKPSAAADAGFNVLAKSKFTIELSKQKEEKKVKPSPPLPGLVAYGGDSDSEPEDGDESEEERVVQEAERAVEEKLIDREKLTCLLCRRAFSSADILQKHQQLSDLHKKNLEDYKKKLTGTVTRAATTGITKKR